MTPFEAKGWTKDMKFKVVANETYHVFCIGDIVWLSKDDGTEAPYFTDGTTCSCITIVDYDQLEVYKPVITKDTIFDLKITGEELLFIKTLLNPGCPDQEVNEIWNKVWNRVSGLIYEVAGPNYGPVCHLDSWDMWNYILEQTFPPQETPEQKEYKELLAQKQSIEVRLAELEKIGGKV